MSSSTKPHDPSNGQTDQKDKPLQINDVLREEYDYPYPPATGDDTCPHPAKNPTDSNPLKGFAAYVHKRGVKRSAQGETGAETTLVVEDNQPVRELTTHVLTELGYRVLVAQHGQDALNLAARHQGPISLLLTDVVMPGISGQELARRLERSRPNMRVLYLSGHPIERLVTRAGDRPITPLLSKPFTSEELSRKVRQILVGQQTPS